MSERWIDSDGNLWDTMPSMGLLIGPDQAITVAEAERRGLRPATDDGEGDG